MSSTWSAPCHRAAIACRRRWSRTCTAPRSAASAAIRWIRSRSCSRKGPGLGIRDSWKRFPESPISNPNPANSMMMPAGAMHMAVGDFLGAGFAHLDDFDGEMQGFSSQRMIAVDGDFVFVDLGDDDGNRAL